MAAAKLLMDIWVRLSVAEPRRRCCCELGGFTGVSAVPSGNFLGELSFRGLGDADRGLMGE